MNQEKIGIFIAECRKNKKLTQEQLADKLGITDRAVSKWERGLNLPDASLMIELCNILDINVNELLTGEIIKKENYMKKAEENLVELKESFEKSNKLLLITEVILLIVCILSFTLMIVASENVTDNILKIILIVSSILTLLITLIISIVIEKEAGYYECGKCHHKYKPTYKQVLFSTHMGWTRYLRCPKCGEKSWNKKSLIK